MILDSDLEVPSAAPVDVSRSPYLSTFSRFRAPFVLLLLFCIVLLLQVASGAYHAEFGGYADPPAHYVTSLMLREYVLGPAPLSPIEFARNYYHHYPKVALGHWPPVLYVVQGLWMTLFSPSRVSVLLELALTTTLLAYAVYAEARRWFGSRPAILAALLTVCLPLVQTYTDEEMAETLLTLFCLLSTISFIRYLDTARWTHSVWFGIFCSLAILTKGSGWLLAMIPPIAIVLTRKFRLLTRPSFWLSVPIVAILCLPWQFATLGLAERGWEGGTQPNLAYTISALGQFGLILFEVAGSVLGVLALIGLISMVLAPMFRKPVAAAPAAMAALIASVWIFHSLVPAGVEDRKMLLAVPAVVLFIFAGGLWIAAHIQLGPRLNRWRSTAILAVTAACFFLQAFFIPHAPHYGYAEAARFITSKPELSHTVMLASSGSIGEGLLISEVAMCRPRPTDTIIRASKVLALVDWNGSHYQAFYSNPAQILSELDHRHIDAVVVDTFSAQSKWPHVKLVKQTIQQNPSRFHLLATFPSGDPAAPGNVQVYRLTP
ncbi:MAG: glycosyltransferase family 39 protein [Acidobacteriaceae bacterium]|nr:glycosyltransferase family 39 protein [Acidobacteriaceae bacterium]